jgi:hypothetical protein
MSYRTFAIVLVCGILVTALGCSNSTPTPAPQTVAPGQTGPGPQAAANPAPAESALKIWLDGQVAQRNTAAQAAPGYTNWQMAKPVSTSPRLKYDITNSRKLGPLSSVNVAIFHETGGRAAQQADFSVYSKDAKAPADIRPGVDYSLGNPGDKIGVLNAANKPASGVKLRPGEKYMLVLIVKGAQTETAQVEFQTK